MRSLIMQETKNKKLKAYIIYRLERACERYRTQGKEDNLDACRYVNHWAFLLGKLILQEGENE